MSEQKDVLTTGDVARICKVAPRTVSKWFDSGQLRGYRIPGSKDRRIPLNQLIRFMKAHGMPLEDLETNRKSILLIDEDSELTMLLKSMLPQRIDCEVAVAESAFEAGAIADQIKPDIILANLDVQGIDGKVLSHFTSVHSDMGQTFLVATGASITEDDREALRQKGFHATLAKPFTIQELVDTIEQAVGLAVH